MIHSPGRAEGRRAVPRGLAPEAHLEAGARLCHANRRVETRQPLGHMLVQHLRAQMPKLHAPLPHQLEAGALEILHRDPVLPHLLRDRVQPNIAMPPLLCQCCLNDPPSVCPVLREVGLVAYGSRGLHPGEIAPLRHYRADLRQLHLPGTPAIRPVLQPRALEILHGHAVYGGLFGNRVAVRIQATIRQPIVEEGVLDIVPCLPVVDGVGGVGATRPSRVSFSATGLSSPYPYGVTMRRSGIL